MHTQESVANPVKQSAHKNVSSFLINLQCECSLLFLVAVVVAFFICWAPFHAQRLLAVYAKGKEYPHPILVTVYTTLTYVSGIFYYLSTTVNPLLYNIMSNKFREAFKVRHFCQPLFLFSTLLTTFNPLFSNFMSKQFTKSSKLSSRVGFGLHAEQK